MKTSENPHRKRSGFKILTFLKRILSDLNAENTFSGMVSGMLAMTAPTIIILQAATTGQFSEAQTISWMFAVNFFGGLLGILFSLMYRIPLTAAHSLSGVAFVATTISQFTYPELIGGYIVSGALIALIGVTGLFSKIIAFVPNNIIASMLSGIMATYVIHLVGSIQTLPIVGTAAVVGYFFVLKWGKRIPAVIGAVCFAFLALLITHSFHGFPPVGAFVMPTANRPEFTLSGVFSLAIPLALLVLSNDIATGLGALRSFQFQPPIRKAVLTSGLASICAGLFGGQSANIAGMMSAICADESSGKKATRYIASLISGVIILVFAVFSWVVVPVIKVLPVAFTAMIAGFALLGPLCSSMRVAFSNSQYPFSAVVSFTIALSGISFFHISAPVWSLVFGILVAKTVERKNEVSS